MDINELKGFLVEANQHGYGNEAIRATKEADNSETILYEKGDWKFHDNWVGGAKFGGREIAFLKGDPIWIMTYHGYPISDKTDLGELYGFLKRALMKMPADLPLRGPEEFSENDWRYTINVEGEIEKFTALEQIFFQGMKVYEANLAGGLVGD